MLKTIGEIIRKQETDFISGTTNISKYVSYSLSDTLDLIDAYHNSKFKSGQTDSLGREKPFFNICVASTNVWFRATDIDRSWLKVRATKSKNWIDSFLANIHLQEWMRKISFGQFLNDWGRVLAKYGSAVVKFVENEAGLNMSVVSWNTLIVDSVEFEGNPVIEIIELTPSQLKQRIKTHGYDKQAVEDLQDALTSRETVNKIKKDNKSDYIKLYEIHGEFPKSFITGKEKDEETYTQQMHVVSFVGKKSDRNVDFQDFELYKGEEKESPYMITHLIKEDGRTLAKGAVELLFDSQFMVNHSAKAIKDNLDLASKLVFQTADLNFVGRNILTNIENGDILIHGLNTPLTQLSNNAMDITLVQNQLNTWKMLGNEIVTVSEAMLGETPKSGTAWRQTEAILQESRSLFEVMIENKGLQVIEMLQRRIIPFLKKKFDTADEVATTLSQYDIEKIDKIYIKKKAIELTNSKIKEKILSGETITETSEQIMTTETDKLREGLSELGNQRFFKPSDLSDKTWKEQFKDLEWALEFDVAGEARNIQEVMTTLQTALNVVINPAFSQNKKAQMIVGKILEATGIMSPLEYNSIEEPPIQEQQEQLQPNKLSITPDKSAGVLLNK